MQRLRRNPRVPLHDRVQLTWTSDDGLACYANGITTDVSEKGLRLESPHPVPERAVVTFRLANYRLHGSGSVRSCHRTGLKYTIGLEFAGGLTFPVETLLTQ
ncbi:MAG: PilZ domain-containing protein [Bryobacterales bacterium]|nr:PilZ domain-containing protein [Bryobacterales bacterium]